MEYYPVYGYEYKPPTYFQEPEFIEPSFDDDSFAKTVLPRNRKRWTFDTEDVHGPFEDGQSIVGGRKPGKNANKSPYEVFKTQTFPTKNKDLVSMEDQLYMGLDVRQIMNWEYIPPKMNNKNVPVWDPSTRQGEEWQTPTIIKPIKHLNSIAGAYMEEPLDRMNFRDRRSFVDGMNKWYSTPNVSIRPDNQDKLINKFKLERICKFTGQETGIAPEFQPQAPSRFVPRDDDESRNVKKNEPLSLSSYDLQGENITRQKVQLNHQKSSNPNVEMRQDNGEHYSNPVKKVQLNHQKSSNPNVEMRQDNGEHYSNPVKRITLDKNNSQYAYEINPEQECFDKYPIQKSKLANELEYNMRIQPSYEEVQVSDFNMTPSTTFKYNHMTRNLTPYLKTEKQQYPSDSELPFYLTANQKDVRPAFKTYCQGETNLCIYDDALAPQSYTSRRKPENRRKYDKMMDNVFQTTFPSYLTQSAQKVHTSQTSIKPVSNENMFLRNVNVENKAPSFTLSDMSNTQKVASSQNMFVPDIIQDVKKQDIKEKNTNRLKYQIRTTDERQKPIRLTVKSR